MNPLGEPMKLVVFLPDVITSLVLGLEMSNKMRLDHTLLTLIRTRFPAQSEDAALRCATSIQKHYESKVRRARHYIPGLLALASTFGVLVLSNMLGAAVAVVAAAILILSFDLSFQNLASSISERTQARGAHVCCAAYIAIGVVAKIIALS